MRGRWGTTVVPILAIAAVFVVAAVLGLGVGDGSGRQEVRREVTALLAGIPQERDTLGSPEAPVTIWIFADLQCPTVRLFAESYLPSILDSWVRTGDVKLVYRSLQTDTVNEQIFFRHEIAAQAAGRQDKMWNFLLTFVHEQGKHFTDFATDEFLTEIASQVPDLELMKWRRDRENALLSKRVALDVYFAHKSGLSSTPSFLVGLSRRKDGRTGGREGAASLRRDVEASLSGHIASLREEAFRDTPTVGPFGTSANGGQAVTD